MDTHILTRRMEERGIICLLSDYIFFYLRALILAPRAWAAARSNIATPRPDRPTDASDGQCYRWRLWYLLYTIVSPGPGTPRSRRWQWLLKYEVPVDIFFPVVSVGTNSEAAGSETGANLVSPFIFLTSLITGGLRILLFVTGSCYR